MLPNLDYPQEWSRDGEVGWRLGCVMVPAHLSLIEESTALVSVLQILNMNNQIRHILV